MRSIYEHRDQASALEFVERLGHDLQDTDLPIEAVNNLVKRVKRIAFGIVNHRNYRIRALLYAGKPNWDLLDTINPAQS